jgi:hypothetical protein
MALPNWSDGGLAQQLGLDESMLLRIINASATAGQQMSSLSGQVEGAAATISAAMQSTAGGVLRSRLQIWHEDFARIINAFVGPNSLNERTQNMLIALRKANADATAGAGGHQS